MLMLNSQRCMYLLRLKTCWVFYMTRAAGKTLLKSTQPLILLVAVLVTAVGCHTGSVRDRQAGPADRPEPGHQWRVRLSWTTETESNSYGFYIHRADREDGEMQVVNSENPLLGAGTTTVPQRYCYYDLDVKEGHTYFYRLEQVDLDGTSRFIVGDPTPVPGKAKPLTEEESAEIRIRGTMFRLEG